MTCAVAAIVLAPAVASAARAGAAATGGARERPPVGPAAVVELHYLMATPVLIAVRGSDEKLLRNAVHAAFGEIHRLGDLCSNFDPQSEVNRLNGRAGAAAVTVAPDLLELLRESRRLAIATRGAFSVTVGPLVDLWKQASVDGSWPSRQALEGALDRSRPGDLVIEGNATVRLVHPGMRLELGGIAKGFAADRALTILRASGADSGLVNLGGSSIAAFGDAGEGRHGWPVELGDFSTREPATLWLRDAALSTSETFGQESRIGPKRVGHLVDPRSGAALSEPDLAVVRHVSATTAEALSKALIVLGKQEGFAVARALEAEAMLVGRDGSVACTQSFADAPPCGASTRSMSHRPPTRHGRALSPPDAALARAFDAGRIPR